jgi:hypothetical protein
MTMTALAAFYFAGRAIGLVEVAKLVPLKEVGAAVGAV